MNYNEATLKINGYKHLRGKRLLNKKENLHCILKYILPIQINYEHSEKIYQTDYVNYIIDEDLFIGFIISFPSIGEDTLLVKEDVFNSDYCLG